MSESKVELELPIKILSPEEVAARSSMPGGNAPADGSSPDVSDVKPTGEISAENPVQGPTQAEMEAVIKEMRERAEAEAKKISDSLSTIGPYALIRFENPVSLRHVITFSEARPSQQALIAVLRQMLLQLETYQARDYWKQADAIDEQAQNREDRKVNIVTPAQMMTGPVLSRAQRRSLLFGRK
jgi:hypothetical protein